MTFHALYIWKEGLHVHCCLMCRTVRNPHALDRYTGGSSSGSAALVASGLCPAALGTDAGGCTVVILHFLYKDNTLMILTSWEKDRFSAYTFFSLWSGGLENNIWTNWYDRVSNFREIASSFSEKPQCFLEQATYRTSKILYFAWSMSFLQVILWL